MADDGAERLVNTIVDDARTAAAAIEKEADDSVDATRDRLERDRAELRAATVKRAETSRRAILDRERVNAELEGRKLLLKKRRELLDRAFDAAYAQLIAMDGVSRQNLILRTLMTEADGGETVCPAACDRDAAAEAIKRFAASSGKRAVTLGENADIEAGFILRAEGYVKDCSFAAILNSVREGCEPSVAAALFG